MARGAPVEAWRNRHRLTRFITAVADHALRGERLAAAAIVAALHLAVCWLLLSAMPPLAIRQWSAPVELVYIQPPATPLQSASPRSERAHRPHLPHPSHPAAIARPQNSAIHPPTDWAGELAREAREAESRPRSRQPRDFGVPHGAVAPAPKVSEFPWDRARTHRVESIPGGGLLIHLNDRCLIVLMPFPWPICKIGKLKVDGDLFKPLHAPGRAGDWYDPYP